MNWRTYGSSRTTRGAGEPCLENLSGVSKGVGWGDEDASPTYDAGLARMRLRGAISGNSHSPSSCRTVSQTIGLQDRYRLAFLFPRRGLRHEQSGRRSACHAVHGSSSSGNTQPTSPRLRALLRVTQRRSWRDWSWICIWRITLNCARQHLRRGWHPMQLADYLHLRVQIVPRPDRALSSVTSAP